jgi:hypothetical protein
MKRIEASIEANGRARPDLRSLRFSCRLDEESRVVRRRIGGSDVATKADEIFNSTDLSRRGEAGRPSPVLGIPRWRRNANS